MQHPGSALWKTMSDNRNKFNISEFLNFEFFENALKNSLGEPNFQLIDVKFTKGHIPGENYASEVYRANATYTSKHSTRSISLIIKCLPRIAIGEFFKEMGVFAHEANVYKDALRHIANILHGEKMVPRFLHYNSNPTEVILLEDASSLGYTLADRVLGLDEEHCALVFRKLGKFHAASIVLARDRPEIYEKLEHDTFTTTRRKSVLAEAIRKNYEYLAEIIKSWPGFEETSVKILRFVANLDKHLENCGVLDNELKVLVHNDLWTNNILFKYKNEKPVDLYFIDFQTTFYSSPGIDLCHFFYTGMQYDVLVNKRDSMVKECYYQTFRSTLEDLGYSPIPTLREIIEEINRREIVGFLWSVLKLYLICMEPEQCENNNLDNINDSEIGPKLRAMGMCKERFVVTMKYILRRMESIGVLV